MAAGLLLLAAAGASVWQTIRILSERRELRTDLAELSHVRYGLLNADRWTEKLTPILDKQIDALDLTTTTGASLRPMVAKSLNSLLDQVKDQLAPKPAPGGGPANFAAAAQALMINNMLAGLKPHIPEYASMVLRQLGSPDNRLAIKNYIRSAVMSGAKATFGNVDTGRYRSILERYGCADGASCQAELGRRIADRDAEVTVRYIVALAAAAIAFLALGSTRIEIAVELLFCIALLLGGLLTPMLEVEAKISSISLTFFGSPISFPEQLLYYQSKSVLEVFHTLLTMGQPAMVLVAVLLLTFSVVFPALKVIAVSVGLVYPGLLKKLWLARFFALESSKWSMADVMALSIFMAYVAFNGLIGNALSGLKGGAAQLVIPTDSSKILPGFYLFVGFCFASLWLAKKLERMLKERQRSELAVSAGREAHY